MAMACDHDYKEGSLAEGMRFGLDVFTFGIASEVAPRKCRKCGEEEP